MIVKRIGIYKVSYRFVWDMYVLSEQGVKIGGGAVTASRQKETMEFLSAGACIEWND